MTAQPADSPLTWSLVVPVKVLARAKSRLAVLAGPHRAALALAMAADTVAAALACPVVDRVIAVTDDAEAARVLAGLGALVTGDEPGRGLNPALRHGAALAAARWPGSAIGALAADLPALRPAELDLGLRRPRAGSTRSCPTRPAPGPRCTRPARARGSGRGSGRGPPAPGRRGGRAQPARAGQPAP
jgi:2-phospho-L-lactate guanylyltransferase